MKTYHIVFPVVMMALLISNILVSFRAEKTKALAKQYLSRAEEVLTNAQSLNESAKIIQPTNSLEFRAYVMGKMFRHCGGSNEIVFMIGDCGHQQVFATMTNTHIDFSYGRVDVKRHPMGSETDL